MKHGQTIVLLVVLIAVSLVPFDLLYASRFVARFKALEKQRIQTSNKLATAKIVSENLAHVRELVFRNMEFQGQKESASQESILFEFLTTCILDLKMKIISVRPSIPTTDGRVTTYGYDIVLEGDFFSLGELCAKLENSQRVLALTSLEVFRPQAEEGPKGKAAAQPPGRGGTIIKMHLDTFRLKKV